MKRNDDWVTALQQWHWGKILMLWIVVPTIGVGFGFGFAAMTAAMTGGGEEAIIFLLLSTVGSIVVMLVVTWLWLTGKERRD